MPESSQTLPLLPLNTGVVLPAMVVTLALETDEAKAAAEAALAGDGHLLLVPYADGRYAKVGTVARVDSAGELPNGMNALILRGLNRAVLGAAVPAPVGAGSGSSNHALYVEAHPIAEREPTDRTRELPKQLRG